MGRQQDPVCRVCHRELQYTGLRTAARCTARGFCVWKKSATKTMNSIAISDQIWIGTRKTVNWGKHWPVTECAALVLKKHLTINYRKEKSESHVCPEEGGQIDFIHRNALTLKKCLNLFKTVKDLKRKN